MLQENKKAKLHIMLAITSIELFQEQQARAYITERPVFLPNPEVRKIPISENCPRSFLCL